MKPRSRGTTRDPCATRLRVLADPTRLAVVRELLEGPRRVAELGGSLGVEQSLLSHHLQVLRRARLVVAERAGRSVRYRLDPEVAARRRRGAIDLGCCRLSFEGEGEAAR